MADSIRWSISVTPVEELADENSGIHSIIHSDVGKSLGGSGTTLVSGNLMYDGAKAIPDNSYVTLSSGSDNVATVYIKLVSGNSSAARAVISIDGGTTSHFALAIGDAILFHPHGAGGFGIAEDQIRVKSNGASSSLVIEYLFDAP